MSISTTTLTEPDELEELAAEWDDLVVAAPRPTPFMLHDWLVEWWAHYGEGRALAGNHSELADVLLRDRADRQAAADVVAQAREGDYDYADLFGLPAASTLEEVAGGRLTVIERADAPVLDLSRSWEDVLNEKLSSKRRYAYRRKRKQLAQLGDLTVSLARTWAEIEPALEEGFRLHALRWDGRPDGTDLQSERGRRFHRAVYKRFADAGIARIISLELDGRAIAFHSYFAFRDALYSDRLAFDPAHARYSPGFLNTLDMLEAAAAEGLRRVEFLGGREEYKLVFADRFEPLHEGFGLARSARGHVAAAAALGVVRLRRRLRDSPVRRIYFEDLAPMRRKIERLRRRDTAVAYADK